jgi:hypothetical protein
MQLKRFSILGLLLILIPGITWAVPKAACNKEVFLQFNGLYGKTSVWKLKGKSPFFFVTGMAIDAHGAPNAYDPDNKRGLDIMARAGRKGNWWSIATDNGKLNGKPLLQKEGPYKGFYVSQTSLRDNKKKNDDITKYVDSTLIPYYALPPQLLGTYKAKLGDLGMVINASNGKMSFAIFADVGARDSIGEGSIALGNLLDVPTDLRGRKAGTRKDIIYLVFPDTAGKPAWPRSIEDMKKTAEDAFQKWGGSAQLQACFPQYNSR